MNKKLLAVAVGAAIAASPVLSAQAADVKVKGRIEVEIVNVDGDAVSEVQQGDKNGQSRWLIDASEDLGNGLTAFGRVAFQTSGSINDGSGEADRDHYAGIKGSFGAISFGRQAGAYKMVAGVGWDPFTATFLQARRHGGMSGDTFGHNGFRNDIVQYKTPKGSPIAVNAQIVLSEESDQDGEYAVGVSWTGGPLEVAFATNNDPSEPDDLQNTKVGARFKSGGFTGFFLYEDVDQGGSIRPNGNRVTTLGSGSFTIVGLSYKFGSNMIAGQVGGFDADSGGSDVDYFGLGVVHFFSKKTRVYAGYSASNVDGIADHDMFGAGIRFDFG